MTYRTALEDDRAKRQRAVAEFACADYRRRKAAETAEFVIGVCLVAAAAVLLTWFLG